MSEMKVHEKQVPNLVNKLIRFLGRREIESALAKYELSKKSHDGSYQAYFIKKRHPWMEALLEYLSLEKSGLFLTRGLSEQVLMLALDARMITELQRTMPDSVKIKYRKNLLDIDNASNYLYEINIAFHHYINNCQIEWYEDDGNKHPEFTVRAGDIFFDVECKRIGFDAFKKIGRVDFYKMIDKLYPKIHNLHLQGQISINLFDKLPHSDRDLEHFIEQILTHCSENTFDSFQTDWGRVELMLYKQDDKTVILEQMYDDLWKRRPLNAQAALCADENKANILEIICESSKADNLADGLRKLLSKASKNQLRTERPGILMCNIPEIDDFTTLVSNSLPQLLSFSLLKSDSRKHVAAIIFTSDPKLQPDQLGKRVHGQALMYRNPNCVYTELKDFPFIDFT